MPEASPKLIKLIITGDLFGLVNLGQGGSEAVTIRHSFKSLKFGGLSG